jgi:DNA-directed RNA polymerase subunit RPC12/RpoP
MADQVTCPACESKRVARIKRRGLDNFFRLFGRYPFKCESCSARFRAPHQSSKSRLTQPLPQPAYGRKRY